MEKNTMFKSKKSQFLIFSMLFLLLLLLYIYSQETSNPYIIDSGKNQVLNTLQYETCRIGKLSNGSQLDARFSSWETNTFSYCEAQGVLCNISIVKQGGAPSNLTLLNYSHYDYSIAFQKRGFSFTGNFTC